MGRHAIEGEPGMLLKDKVAVIYGGGGAIGRAAARVFAREGATVFLVGRTQQRLDTIARESTASSGKVETAQLDVLDETAVAKHASSVATQAGGIDIVLNATSAMHDQGTPLADRGL
jgi:NADP-dependent 3-hydroxy acid dehydrogenase YdfG